MSDDDIGRLHSLGSDVREETESKQSLHQEISALNNRMIELESQALIKDRTIQGLSARAQTLESDVGDMQNRLSSEKSSNQALSACVTDLKALLESEKQHADVLQVTNDKLETELDGVEARSHSVEQGLCSERDIAKANAEKLQRKVADLEGQLSEQKRSCEVLASENQSLQRVNEKLREDKVKAESQRRVEQDTTSELRREQLKAKLEGERKEKVHLSHQVLDLATLASVSMNANAQLRATLLKNRIEADQNLREQYKIMDRDQIELAGQLFCQHLISRMRDAQFAELALQTRVTTDTLDQVRRDKSDLNLTLERVKTRSTDALRRRDNFTKALHTNARVMALVLSYTTNAFAAAQAEWNVRVQRTDYLIEKVTKVVNKQQERILHLKDLWDRAHASLRRYREEARAEMRERVREETEEAGNERQ